MPFTIRRIAAAIAVSAVAAVTGTAAAQADTPAQSAVAKSVKSGPFTFDFEAHRAAEAPENAATGTFHAKAKLGGVQLMDLEGPVTCLNVRGNRVGLYYPVAKSTPSLFSMINAGVMIYMTVDGKGQATSMSFLPVPFTSRKNCAPTPANVLPATGSATLTS